MVNKLYNSCCLDIMGHLADNSVDFVVTDRPYKVVSGGCTNKGG